MKVIYFWLIIIQLFAIHLCPQVSAKYVEGRTYMTPGKITEVTKFNFGQGTGVLNGTIEYMGEPKGEVYLFMDTLWWDKFHSSAECEKIKHAHSHFPIGQVGNRINTGLGVARGLESTEAKNRKKRWSFTWTITHRVRTYGWYVVMADCTSEVQEDAKGRKKNRFHQKISYELELLNNGNDHLSTDERWLTEMYIFTTIFLFGTWQYFSTQMRKNFGAGPVHLIIKFLRIAYVLQILSMMFEIIHQVVYRYNGTGIWIIDYFSELLEGFSQTLISFVLLCLANGWTLYKKTAKDKYEYSMSEVMNDPSLMDIDNPVLFFLILFLFISMMLQLVNKLYDDSFMKFHDHETTAGFFLVVMRFLLGVLYLVSFFNTIKAQEKKGAGQNLLRFMRHLMVFGALWFLAFPLIVLIASFFAHYLRHFFVTAGVLGTQSLCLCVLSYQFISDKSSFARFSEIQQTGMLPGFSRAANYNKFV